MPKIKREYTIALMMIGALVLLYYGINYLKGLNVLQGRNVFYAKYNDVSGITGSSPLFFHGFKVGQVVGTQLMPDGSGRIAVAFQVDADDLKLPRDSRLEIYSADLFTRAAQIVLGDSSVMAQRGDTLLGDAQLSLTETVNQQIDPLKRKAEAMIASVDSVLTSVQGILNKDARGHLDGSFAEPAPHHGEREGDRPAHERAVRCGSREHQAGHGEHEPKCAARWPPTSAASTGSSPTSIR
ncbi:MAG: MCE family protein [Flavobacteriales bacterium]|nr:MCE family protein [Flavobacteriales bacterium]